MEVRKLLVANRGEIALRVFRTAPRARASRPSRSPRPTTRGSLHARSADERERVGSYLWSEEHIQAALRTGADAIHPGYGFLAESGDFAEAVGAAGLLWIGPPPDALRDGGDKLEARRIAIEAGVPVVPGGAPEELGFPLLVKAAAGGGGRGMRVVRSPAELDDAVEAARARGEGGVPRRPAALRALPRAAAARRDPAARRRARHRARARRARVLGAAPPPEGARGDARRVALDADLRARMSEAAIRFARAVGYVGAGTAEFVLDGRDFYFLELNGRIQVEHPVTEAVTGLDLVEQQIRVAARRAARPARRRRSGHAVEVRLYAEDPRTFLPQAGRIERLRLPAAIRVDAGVEEGDEVGTALRPDAREADRARRRRATRRSTGSPRRSPRPRSRA